MLLTILRWITFSFIIIFFLIYFQGGIVFIRERASRNKVKSPLHFSVLTLIMALITLSILILCFLICLHILVPVNGLNNFITVLIGFVLFAIGAISNLISKFFFLKKTWSSNIHVATGQTIINKGLYSVIRHPIYFFSILFFSGTALVFPALVNLILAVLICICYCLLASLEDSYLLQKLKGYKTYQKRVRYKLFPFIW